MQVGATWMGKQGLAFMKKDKDVRS